MNLLSRWATLLCTSVARGMRYAQAAARRYTPTEQSEPTFQLWRYDPFQRKDGPKHPPPVRQALSKRRNQPDTTNADHRRRNDINGPPHSRGGTKPIDQRSRIQPRASQRLGNKTRPKTKPRCQRKRNRRLRLRCSRTDPNPELASSPWRHALGRLAYLHEWETQ